MARAECPVQEISHIMTMYVLRYEIVYYGTGTPRMWEWLWNVRIC